MIISLAHAIVNPDNSVVVKLANVAKTGDKKKRVRRTPEEARALILAATQELIVERGPDRLGLVTIAERAGVSHSLISHYFGSIDNLLETALTQNIDERRRELIEMLPTLAESGPEGFIEHFFERAGDPLFSRLTIWSILSGRISAADFGPAALGSGKLFADALQAHFRDKTGGEVSRESLDAIILLTMCTGIGYSLAGDAFWRGLGRERTDELDRTFRKVLSRMIKSELGVD